MKMHTTLLRRVTATTVVILSLLAPTIVDAQRIKDLGRVEGVREVTLKGPGLVIGLPGTGDKERSPITREFYAAFMESMGKEFSIDDIRSKNVAVVLVTAKIPTTTKIGSRIEVTVSSIGDAKSLKGGILLETALGLVGRGVLGSKEDPVVAVAQGRVDVAGDIGTVGRGSGTLEYDISMPFVIDDNSFRVILHNPDFSTAGRVAQAINDFPYLRYNLPGELPLARALDSGSVTVTIPERFRPKDQIVTFISKIMGEVQVPQIDRNARVVIDDATGMVTINGKVRIAPVVVLVGEIKISVTGDGNDETLPYLTEVMDQLRNEGVTNKEMPSIIRSIDAAGALVGELVER